MGQEDEVSSGHLFLSYSSGHEAYAFKFNFPTSPTWKTWPEYLQMMLFLHAASSKDENEVGHISV
jgi:hypothetical protein